MSVTAEFEYNAAEHYRAMRVVERLTPLRWVLWAMAVVAMLVVAGSLWFARAQGRPLSELMLNYAPYATFFVMWGILMRYLQRRTAKRLPLNDRSLIGTQRRTLDETGYHSEGNGVALTIPWAAFHRAVQTEEFQLLFYNKLMAYYIPLRALSAEQRAAMRGVLQAGLPAERLRFLDAHA